MEIRPATTADLEGIRKIYEDAILNTTAVYEYEPFDMAYMQRWWEEKNTHNFPVHVAVEENKIVGFCTYGIFRARPAYYPTKEHSVYVHPEYRGMGIGKMLLEKIIALAKTEGVHTLIGGIDATNQTSIALHEQFGFETVGHLKQVAYKFDRWLDLVFMQKLI
jgi:phosphinothricin acetyltransferase